MPEMLKFDFINQTVTVDPPSTRQTRSEAEVAVKPKAAHLREVVYRAVLDHGPVTDEQIAIITGLAGNTARPRRLELERAGRIAAVGASRTRSGRRAVSWAVVPERDF